MEDGSLYAQAMKAVDEKLDGGEASLDEFIPKFKGMMNEITDRIIVRIQERFEVVNAKRMELIAMRNSLDQSLQTMNASQGGWAVSAFNSLAGEILKTCKDWPKSQTDIVLNEQALETGIWNIITCKK